jgi:hypothetical protein
MHLGEVAIQPHALAANQPDGRLNLRRRHRIRFVGHGENDAAI